MTARKVDILGQDSDEEDHPPKHSVNEQLSKLGANLRDIERVKRKYPMKITPYYLGLINKKDDPIWKQAVPSIEELQDVYNIEDPLREEEHTKTSHLVHKYPDRVLLLVSSKCAMYCRFCTRKRKVGRVQQIPMEEIFQAIDYIANHEEIRDVIISGGDPLTRTDKEIESILQRLRAIPHVDIIRIGTRMPCVQPSRITKKLSKMLKKYHPLFMNIHFNHPQEITEETAKACAMLADAGIPLGSQTVLLRGINDSPEMMKSLMQKLVKIRVKPYYIYQCDLVKGVEHFRTPVNEGIEIMKKLQGYTSGLCVPQFVIDGPGGKIPVSPQYVKDITGDQIIMSNYMDNIYSHPNPYKGPTRKAVEAQGLRIGLAFNLKRPAKNGEVHDKYSEFDDITTIDAVRKGIESGGHSVVLLEADQEFPEKVRRANVDFVFNMAEGLSGESRESHVPAILEMFGIPYSGSGVLTQSITLNKNRTKEILRCHNIPTPGYQLFTGLNHKKENCITFPAIVKPNSEGSSKGIDNGSLVEDEESLKKKVKHLLKNYSQDALVEEYCPGREFTLSIIGNEKPKILPIVEVTFDHLPSGMNKFDSYEAKWTYDNPENKADPLICPARLEPALKKSLETVALNTYSALGCVDFCRIDMRLDKNGVPNVIDVNAIPGLIPDPKENSRFPRACYAAGMSYNDMILAILNSALKRNKLVGEEGRRLK
ncbi:MAG: KamA family radical SAM protein [Candidatus Thermoplasmatota archaeon]|nr:KamA family radical SAM protein [Candidatus Thermoplasmatota archaeon]